MKEFYLDTNNFFGVIDSLEKWQEAIAAQKNEAGVEHLLETRICHDSEERGMPYFDYHPYIFEKELESTRITLREWLAKNNINLPC